MNRMTVLVLLIWPITTAGGQEITGEVRVWHALTLTVDGPRTSETADPNPFRHYRMTVTFRQGEHQYVVPGYFAADGNAAESGTTNGSKWRAHFVPDRPGPWSYRISFRSGPDLAINKDASAGLAIPPDGIDGKVTVARADPKASGFLAKGRLRYVAGRYLQHAGTGEYFLKGGADSPENLLGYAGFDDTWIDSGGKKNRRNEATRPDRNLHRYLPHVTDWQPGDPTWRGTKGKGIIGALNYLASEGMNSVYFLTMNVGGDGYDVWPWIKPDLRDRFDCSKLDQWNIVFDHMDRLGIALHVLTQETENDQLLDGGQLGTFRKLYYRELIARFSHHLGVVWNLGEENTNTTEQIRQFSDFFKRLDPYRNAVVVHTFPDRKEDVYTPLLGHAALDGPSLQFSDDWDDISSVVHQWVRRSAEAGHPWFVCVDEPGTAKLGVDHDAKTEQNNQDTARQTALWGALMAGGAGVEWYFGYSNPHNDLNCEDWRSRDRLWDYTRHALNFFQKHLPYHEMAPRDDLVQGDRVQCLAHPGEVYAVYLRRGGRTQLDLGTASGAFDVRWYDPRRGDGLLAGNSARVHGPGRVSLGPPPRQPDQDWAVLVRRKP